MYILEDLYNGNVHPAEYQFPKGGAYAEAIRKVAEVEKRLMNSLNTEQNELLNEFRRCLADADLIDNFHAFRAGFQLGVQLTLDALPQSQV